ncbi:lamin tail domain-containing protein [Halorussus salinisoli]|uniref:lamin tail domain-containing protein n=1 Tax=Halorussus salinisoli TaxID=2558242 RepID=UPI002A90A21C|nr:lamin tail domain-containing protein [Halorussus salinisoli]
MTTPTTILGDILLFLGVVLFFGAFIFPILAGLNVRGSRDFLTRHLNNLPGFRTGRWWRVVMASFVYLMVTSTVLGVGGVALLPESTGGNDATPSSNSANGTSTAVLAASTPTTSTTVATATEDTPKPTTTSTTESGPTIATSSPTTRAPEELAATIQPASDDDASTFDITIRANTRLKSADSGNEDFGEPYFVIEVGGETVLETDDVDARRDGKFEYRLSKHDLDQFESGTHEVTVRLMDRDVIFDDEIASWSGSMQYEAVQTTTPTTTPPTTPSPTTPTETQTQTTTAQIQTPASTPNYEIESTENLSYLGVVRLEVNVKTEQSVARLSDTELRRISRDVVASKAAETKLSAVSIFFWNENAAVGLQQASARIDWAPDGKWSKAGDVARGDYSTHEYALERFTTSTPTTTTESTPTTESTTRITTPTETPTPTTTTTTPDQSSQSEWTVSVLEVVDGDTLKVEFPDGRVENVRLLGVDTPEVHVETDPAEFEGIPETEDGRDHLRDWGHKASEFARMTLLDEEIRVQVDSTADRRGSYDRLLVYVYHDDGELFNRQLIDQGYARLYESEFSKREAFERAESQAQSETVGLWGIEQTATTTTTTDGGDSQQFAVMQIHADATGNDHENENDEYLVFKNTGESTLDLSDWRLSDAADHTYRFPTGFELAPGETVTLYTGSGTNTDSELYWGSDAAIWDNNGDTILVRNGDGDIILKRSY